MRERFYRYFTGSETISSALLFIGVIVLLLSLSILQSRAASPDPIVVISEVMWMGSDLSTADEWVELAVLGQEGSVLDVSGWRLTSVLTKGETTITLFSTGTVLHAGQFFLISNYFGAATRLAVAPNLVSTAMSLPNSALLLRLRDAAGVIRDEVDDGVGVPFAGANVTGSPKASMERISMNVAGNLKENWRTAVVSRGFKDGVVIYGTPGSWNGELVVSSVSSGGSDVSFSSDGGLGGSASVSSEITVSSISESSSEHFSSDGTVSDASSDGLASKGSSFDSVSSSVSAPAEGCCLGDNSGCCPVVGDSSSSDSLQSTADSSVSFTPRSSASEVGSASSGRDSSLSEAGSSSDPQAGMPALVRVKITEILANPVGSDDREWIEIGNLGDKPVSIAGWKLTSGSGAHSFIIPNSRTATGAFPPRVSSPFTLDPAEHVSFRKTFSHLTLVNGGSRVAIFSGSVLVDALNYPEALEGISFGRIETGSGFALQSFCIPTEGFANTVLPLDPRILLQETNGSVTSSGAVRGVGHVSVNFSVVAETGSLSSARCTFDYGDGTLYHSCNPPSHSFDVVGEHAILLTLEPACGGMIERTFLATVLRTGSSDASGIAPEESVCAIRSYSGAVLSEILPYPHSKQPEWLEIENTTGKTLALCGWSIVSAKGQSLRGALSTFKIHPHGFLAIASADLGLHLGNAEDTVRLLSPAEAPVSVVAFSGAIRGQSLARRQDGEYVWTTFPTPGEPNRFRTGERRFRDFPVIVSAAYPNPPGDDAGREWVEIQNRGREKVSLGFWSLDTGEGSGTPFPLDGIELQPLEVKRFSDSELHLRLKNSRGRARLLDPDRYVASVLGWPQAAEDMIVRPPTLDPASLRVRVPYVIDGDTIVVALDDFPAEVWRTLPPELERRWSSLRLAGETTIRVRLIGIDAPELTDPHPAVRILAEASRDFLRSQIEGKFVDLTFDESLFDKYDRLLAYVNLGGGDSAMQICHSEHVIPSCVEERTATNLRAPSLSVQESLLRHGLARAYTVFPFARSQEYLALEEEARAARLGIWADPEVSKQVLVGFPEGSTLLKYLQTHKLTLKIDPKSGLVASGTVIQFSPSVAADVFVSTNSGAYRFQSGGLLVTDDLELKAYAEARFPTDGSGTEVFRSSVVERQFAVRCSLYASGVVMSEVYAVPSSLTPPSPLHPTRLLGEGGLQFKFSTEEWIELQNLSASPVSLSFWQLDDRANTGSKPYTIPFGTVIGSGGYLLFPSSVTKLSLNNGGDDVRLLSPDGETVDFVTYSKGKSGFSLSRVGRLSRAGSKDRPADSRTGSGTAWCVSDPTPGEGNRCLEVEGIAQKTGRSKGKVLSNEGGGASSNALARGEKLISDSTTPNLTAEVIGGGEAGSGSLPVSEVAMLSIVCLAGCGLFLMRSG